MSAGILNLTLVKGLDFVPVQITCMDALGAPVPLAGWAAYAHVRRKPDGPLVLDLAPVIAADDAAGLVEIPHLPWATTQALAYGSYVWDLILETPAGVRIGPLLAGSFNVVPINTQPA